MITLFLIYLDAMDKIYTTKAILKKDVQRLKEEAERESQERYAQQAENARKKNLYARDIIYQYKEEIAKAIDTAQKRSDVLLSSLCVGELVTIFSLFNNIGIATHKGLGDYEIGKMKWAAMFFISALLLNFFKSIVSVLILSHISKVLAEHKAKIDSHIMESWVNTKIIKQPSDTSTKTSVLLIYISSTLAFIAVIIGIVLLGQAVNHYINGFL